MVYGKIIGGLIVDIVIIFIGFVKSVCNLFIYSVRYRVFWEIVKWMVVRKRYCI